MSGAPLLSGATCGFRGDGFRGDGFRGDGTCGACDVTVTPPNHSHLHLTTCPQVLCLYTLCFFLLQEGAVRHRVASTGTWRCATHEPVPDCHAFFAHRHRTWGAGNPTCPGASREPTVPPLPHHHQGYSRGRQRESHWPNLVCGAGILCTLVPQRETPGRDRPSGCTWCTARIGCALSQWRLACWTRYWTRYWARHWTRYWARHWTRHWARRQLRTCMSGGVQSGGRRNPSEGGSPRVGTRLLLLLLLLFLQWLWLLRWR